MTATLYAGLVWPNLKRGKPPRLAAVTLGKLITKGLVRRRIEPTDYYKGGPVPPRFCYYLTELGYSVYDYWKRQR